MTWTRDRNDDSCFVYQRIMFTRQKRVVEFKPSLTSKEATRSSQDRISEATNTKSNDELLPVNSDAARHDKLPQPKADLEKSAVGLFMDDGDFVEDRLIKKTMCFKMARKRTVWFHITMLMMNWEKENFRYLQRIPNYLPYESDERLLSKFTKYQSVMIVEISKYTRFLPT